MSDAEVRFHRLDGMPADTGEEQTFGFRCPRRGHRCEGLVIAGRTDLKYDPQGHASTSAQHDGIAQHKGERPSSRAMWGWDGNAAAPTFTPSINCHRCGWHGYILNGRCKSVDGNDEPEPA